MTPRPSAVLIAALIAAVASPAGAAGTPDAATPSPDVTAASKAASDTKAAVAGLPALDTLRAPDAPAFSILGVSPSEIQRPTSLSQLGVSLGAFLSNGSVVVPNSFAMEVAPYWLVSHPTLTLQEYEIDRWGKIYRSTTLSVGTLSGHLDGPPVSGYTELATGLRTKLYDGEPSVACAKELAAAQDKAADLAAWFLPPDGTKPEDVDPWMKQRAAELDQMKSDILPKLSEGCMTGAAARRGLLVDAAGATAWRFPSSAFSSGKLTAASAWITAAYAQQYITLLLLARFNAQNLEAAPERAVDVGGRLVFLRDRYGLSAEAIYRRVFSGTEGNRSRLTVGADYLVGGSSWLTFSFGRDGLTQPDGTLVAVATVKWGFGDPVLKR